MSSYNTYLLKIKMGERLQDRRKQLHEAYKGEPWYEHAGQPYKTQENFVEYINGSAFEKTRPKELIEETYKKWEQGKNQISPEWVLFFCDILKCDAGYLYGQHDQLLQSTADISKDTGLSEQVIEILRAGKTVTLPYSIKRTEIINKLFENDFERVITEIFKAYNIKYGMSDKCLEKQKVPQALKAILSETLGYKQYETLSDSEIIEFHLQAAMNALHSTVEQIFRSEQL